jgi:hypothetical protein
MRGKERITEGVNLIGKKMRQARSSVLGEVKSIGGTLSRKTAQLRSSLRNLTKKSRSS